MMLSSTKTFEKIAVNALKEIKAVNIAKLDVRHLTSITDTMIICTGTSNRHVKSLADNVLKRFAEQKVKPISLEGEQDGEWILIDFSDIMVHIMLSRTREFYQLEKLWNIPKLSKKNKVNAESNLKTISSQKTKSLRANSKTKKTTINKKQNKNKIVAVKAKPIKKAKKLMEKSRHE